MRRGLIVFFGVLIISLLMFDRAAKAMLQGAQAIGNAHTQEINTDAPSSVP